MCRIDDFQPLSAIVPSIPMTTPTRAIRKLEECGILRGHSPPQAAEEFSDLPGTLSCDHANTHHRNGKAEAERGVSRRAQGEPGLIEFSVRWLSRQAQTEPYSGHQRRDIGLLRGAGPGTRDRYNQARLGPADPPTPTPSAANQCPPFERTP